MSIEDVLSSKGRVRILRILVEIEELNISEIARRAGLNYATTNQHLQALENAGLVRHKRFGRIRIFRFNEVDSRAKIIKKLIENWRTNK
ncbi:MAG: winged helix-turn-helix domain-containing protein [Candidatus Bathyarchaeota archaeon]|jgi:DNA-binding transcriptional ArsR family regulator|nr:winged helix-turn-helix domain-containing protein [Candidatus Bathyarchaeota archaeon]